MFRFRVELTDAEGVRGKTYEAEAKARDVVRWENLPRSAGREPRFVGQLQSAPSLTALTELAWCASQRLDLVELSLKDFLRQADVTGLASEEESEGDEGLDPTRPGR